LRDAFLRTSSLPERIREFHRDRVAALVAGEGPTRLGSTSFAVLTVVPFAAFGERRVLNIYGETAKRLLEPLVADDVTKRANVEGFLAIDRSYDREERLLHRGYALLHRTGAVEFADASWAVDRRTVLIPAGNFEASLLRGYTLSRDILQDLGVPPPVVVQLTLTGVRDIDYAVDQGRVPVHFDRDRVELPDVLIESYDTEADVALRPILDALWNAVGYEHNLNYGNDNRWMTPQARYLRNLQRAE
jgi:hypothetical protein